MDPFKVCNDEASFSNESTILFFFAYKYSLSRLCPSRDESQDTGAAEAIICPIGKLQSSSATMNSSFVNCVARKKRRSIPDFKYRPPNVTSKEKNDIATFSEGQRQALCDLSEQLPVLKSKLHNKKSLNKNKKSKEPEPLVLPTINLVLLGEEKT